MANPIFKETARLIISRHSADAVFKKGAMSITIPVILDDGYREDTLADLDITNVQPFFIVDLANYRDDIKDFTITMGSTNYQIIGKPEINEALNHFKLKANVI